LVVRAGAAGAEGLAQGGEARGAAGRPGRGGGLAPGAAPAGAEAKGYDEVLVQEVVFRRENILFRKEKCYAAATGETYTAALPAGYAGAFGPNLRALVLVLYFACTVSEGKIRELLGQVGVAISKGQLSNLLVKGKAGFHAEKAALVDAGLASGRWQQTDHTATRVNGRNQHCQVLGNPAYTAYATTPTKDRQSVLGVLRNGRPAAYLWNAEAAAYLEGTGLSAGVRRQLAALPEGERLDEAQLGAWLAEHVPKLGPQQRRRVEDGLGLAAYHAATEHPVVELLLSDDAPQFAGVARAQALCWVHEGRLYKQLTPYLPGHRRLLDDFLAGFWGYYHQLRAYREAPGAEAAAALSAEFDRLFAAETGYLALDNRIALTRAKKGRLLRVLAHPALPLHNNAAELAVRQRVRKRDVSFGPRTEDGKQAWDTFATLLETGKKLGLSFYELMRDRLTHAGRIPPLADLVRQRAAELHLNDSATAH
jgi:hypothetical protein